LVVFDQLRADYLTRWDSLFRDGGFHRLEKDGAWFQNCHYPYACTVTAAGHASLVTGCSPNKHGIVENDWYERSAGKTVYCVASDHFQRVPPVNPGSKDQQPVAEWRGGVSPERLLVPSVGDALKAVTATKARVVSLSLKDRSAVFLGGRRADACCWFDSSTGQFVTSTYYAERLHPWVAEYNEAHLIERWAGREWIRLRPDLDYARYSGPDDVVGEDKGVRQGRTFPHPFPGSREKPGILYYEALYNSPFGNEILLELARRAIDAEHLGTRDVADLLCLSFSCNDPIGHCWGPDSQEVMDVTLRSDRIVRDLLAYLDAKVGKGRYILALSADHGVCPLPEVARAQGKDARRVSPSRLAAQVREFMEKRFGKGERWIEAFSFPWIYLNQDALHAHDLKSADVEEALVRWLKEQPDILTAYSRTQLLHGLPKGDAIGESVRRSFYPERCGDVVGVLKPYYLLTSRMTGTSHGTPHAYDTHVPLLVYGPGIPGGIRDEAVTPQAVAAIFAQALGIPPPAAAEARVPESLYRKR
jgi:hypothetical protein